MTDTKPCARCGKQNPAEIHTCTPLALRLADYCHNLAAEIDHYRTDYLYAAAEELRRLHAENEGLKRALRGIRINAGNAEAVYRTAKAAIAIAEGPAQGESVVG